MIAVFFLWSLANYSVYFVNFAMLSKRSDRTYITSFLLGSSSNLSLIKSMSILYAFILIWSYNICTSCCILSTAMPISITISFRFLLRFMASSLSAAQSCLTEKVLDIFSNLFWTTRTLLLTSAVLSKGLNSSRILRRVSSMVILYSENSSFLQ